MIKSVRGIATRQFIESGKSKFSGMDQELADQRLQEIDSAISLESFGKLRSVGLHKLTGDRRGFWSVRINGPWRIVFRFEEGHAYDVEIIDYH